MRLLSYLLHLSHRQQGVNCGIGAAWTSHHTGDNGLVFRAAQFHCVRMSHDSGKRRGSKSSPPWPGPASAGAKGGAPSLKGPGSRPSAPLYPSLDAPFGVQGLAILHTALLDAVSQCRPSFAFDSTMADQILRFALDKGRLKVGSDFEKCVLAVPALDSEFLRVAVAELELRASDGHEAGY